MLTSLPNLLTLSRIVAIPLIVALLFLDGEEYRWAAFGLYVLASITDFFDGYAARAMGQISKFGRFLDPIADKLLVVSIILMVIAVGQVSGIHVIACLIIVLREITVSGLREFLAEIQVGVPVSKLAKWKTAIQLIALGFLILGDAPAQYFDAAIIGQILIWVAALLTMVTGFDYLRAGLKHMTDAE